MLRSLHRTVGHGRHAHLLQQMRQFSRCPIVLGNVLGIRREDKDRWERRAPLAPFHVQQLVNQGIDVVVQPSPVRIFPNDAYESAGAKVQEDLSAADTIIGVKEIPSEKLLDDKTYMFFSHTIKAQPSNMPMLDMMLRKNIRLIDYERIVDRDGNRLVRFGRHAGIAGMIDMIRALGSRFIALGHNTPFLHLGFSHMYTSLDMAKQAVAAVGEEIALKGVPNALAPMIFVFTGGDGACSKGAREIFELLPHKYVRPDQLAELSQSRDPGHRFRLYGCVVSSKDYVVPNNPGEVFHKRHYYEHPEEYTSLFHQKIAPYASVVVNGVYWDERFPRLLTKAQMKELGSKRLFGIADLSCDVGGGIEAVSRATSIDEPTYIYDPSSETTTTSVDGKGVIIMAVNNLPTEIPMEASCHFGDSLLPHLPAIVRSDPTLPYEEMYQDLPAEAYGAVITAHGELTPPYQYITERRFKYNSTMKRVLVLGAGLVTPGLINSLCKDSNNLVTVASQSLEEAQKIATSAKVTPIELDVRKEKKRTETLISQHQVVVSVLPQSFHPFIAEMCIKNKTHMVTASYIRPEMQALDEQAREAGVTILNEIGLDPGIDHMSAIKTIEQIKAKGGKITSFKSVTGGLPAPEYADNPFYYKFSWNPRGVLQAGSNPALYLKDGKKIEVEGDKLFLQAEHAHIHPCFSMEVLPNRDSIKYIDVYGLQDSATVFRGTLRYQGFSGMMWAIKELGLLDPSAREWLDSANPQVKNWPSLLKQLLGKGVTDENLRQKVEEKVFGDGSKVPEVFNTRYFRKRTMRAFEWLKFFDKQKAIAPQGTLIDTLCSWLSEVLEYEPHERDMILMQHTLDVTWPDERTETLRSSLIAFGTGGGESAMSKTVGYPLGIASKLILGGAVKTPGVIRPVTPEIYNPLLEQLRDEGIWFSDNIGA